MTGTTARSDTLAMPGATLYYEVRGSGPPLLLIPGGPQDAGVFADLAGELAGRYTVAAYDPRGNSRSVLAGTPEDQRLDQHGDDAARLIEALGLGPAYIFGTSGGAQIGLNLAARYPALVRALVAHEPPCLLMLDDPAEAIAGDRALYETYRREGVDAAMQQFFGENGLEDGPGDPAAPPPSPEEIATFERVAGNFEYWLAHGLLPLSLYRPDLDALRAGGVRVIVGLGEESVGQPIHGIGTAFAAKLGVAPVAFPGDHVGFGPHAADFARALHLAFGAD